MPHRPSCSGGASVGKGVGNRSCPSDGSGPSFAPAFPPAEPIKRIMMTVSLVNILYCSDIQGMEEEQFAERLLHRPIPCGRNPSPQPLTGSRPTRTTHTSVSAHPFSCVATDLGSSALWRGAQKFRAAPLPGGRGVCDRDHRYIQCVGSGIKRSTSVQLRWSLGREKLAATECHSTHFVRIRHCE